MTMGGIMERFVIVNPWNDRGESLGRRRRGLAELINAVDRSKPWL